MFKNTFQTILFIMMILVLGGGIVTTSVIETSSDGSSSTLVLSGESDSYEVHNVANVIDTRVYEVNSTIRGHNLEDYVYFSELEEEAFNKRRIFYNSKNLFKNQMTKAKQYIINIDYDLPKRFNKQARSELIS